MNHYILKGKTPVMENDTLKWAKGFERANRRVAHTTTKYAEISTVFLGIDHRFGDKGLPLLFETLVFGGKLKDKMERYSTWDKAVQGHYEMVKKVRAIEK